MNLTFRQLQTFVEVMRAGSISAAARSLGRTQPAVSSTILGLEQEIGFALFERERKRLVPKPEAHYFFEEAEIVLSRMTQASRTIREVGNLEQGTLKIVCSPAASIFFIPNALADFLADKPKVKASVVMQTSVVATEWIASQQYDVGFGEFSGERRTVRAQRFAFPCLCALPSTSDLVSRQVITPADLAGRPMAAVQEQHTLSSQTRDAFAASGVEFTQRFEFHANLPALKLVSEGLCYAICDNFSALNHQSNFKENSGVVFRPFEPAIYLEMALMSPASRPISRLAEEFLRVLESRLDRYMQYRG